MTRDAQQPKEHNAAKEMYQILRMSGEFLSLMRMKLNENLHKGSWRDCTYDYLRSRIDEELEEFDLAIQERRFVDARIEAADVANFLAMISDNLEYSRFDELRELHPNLLPRPHPAPAAECDNDCLSCDTKIYISCEKRINPNPATEAQEVRGFVMIDRQRDFSLWLAEHDAAIRAEVARQAREESQQRIDAVIKELGHLRDGQYNDIVGHNVRYAYDYAIILLRQQAGDHK